MIITRSPIDPEIDREVNAQKAVEMTTNTVFTPKLVEGLISLHLQYLRSAVEGSNQNLKVVLIKKLGSSRDCSKLTKDPFQRQREPRM